MNAWRAAHVITEQVTPGPGHCQQQPPTIASMAHSGALLGGLTGCHSYHGLVWAPCLVHTIYHTTMP